eukprot:754157-Amphidinium_carterae.1
MGMRALGEVIDMYTTKEMQKKLGFALDISKDNFIISQNYPDPTIGDKMITADSFLSEPN